MSLILNKDQTGVGIEASDIERLFPRGFRSKIPFSREVPRSMNAGMPVISTAPDSAVATELITGIVDFLPADSQEAARAELAGRRPTPWYRRLVSRREDVLAT